MNKVSIFLIIAASMFAFSVQSMKPTSIQKQQKSPKQMRRVSKRHSKRYKGRTKKPTYAGIIKNQNEYYRLGGHLLGPNDAFYVKQVKNSFFDLIDKFPNITIEEIDYVLDEINFFLSVKQDKRSQ